MITEQVTKKRYAHDGKDKTALPSPKEFLEKNVPKFNGSTSYVIKDLWPRHFRINYYKKDTEHTITSSKIIGSYFISVEKSPDGYVLKNHTIDDSF